MSRLALPLNAKRYSRDIRGHICAAHSTGIMWLTMYSGHRLTVIYRLLCLILSARFLAKDSAELCLPRTEFFLSTEYAKATTPLFRLVTVKLAVSSVPV